MFTIKIFSIGEFPCFIPFFIDVDDLLFAYLIDPKVRGLLFSGFNSFFRMFCLFMLHRFFGLFYRLILLQQTMYGSFRLWQKSCLVVVLITSGFVFSMSMSVDFFAYSTLYVLYREALDKCFLSSIGWLLCSRANAFFVCRCR